MLLPHTGSFDVILHFGTALVLFFFTVEFVCFMHCELFARELTDDMLKATLLNSSVIEVYG
jgi:hypothetical protein